MTPLVIHIAPQAVLVKRPAPIAVGERAKESLCVHSLAPGPHCAATGANAALA